jgi:hypothetical protein
MVYKNKQGKKLYPVCSWENNQHKLYNTHDRLMNALAEAEENNDGAMIDKVSEEIDRLDEIMEAFGRYVIGGIVYATYEDRCKILDYTVAYDVRHDMRC